MAFRLKFNSETPDIRVVRDAIFCAISTSRFTAKVDIRWSRSEKGRSEIVIEEVRLREKKGYCGNHPGACVVPRKHKKMNYLEGVDWVEWNDMLNDIMDEHHADADAASSHVIIRKGKKRCVSYTDHFLNAATLHRDWDKDSGQFEDWCGRIAKRSLYPEGTPGGEHEHDNEPLGAFEQWMVRSNLKTIKDEGIDSAVIVKQLRANGYPRIAAAVEQQCKEVAA